MYCWGRLPATSARKLMYCWGGLPAPTEVAWVQSRGELRIAITPKRYDEVMRLHRARESCRRRCRVFCHWSRMQPPQQLILSLLSLEEVVEHRFVRLHRFDGRAAQLLSNGLPQLAIVELDRVVELDVVRVHRRDDTRPALRRVCRAGGHVHARLAHAKSGPAAWRVWQHPRFRYLLQFRCQRSGALNQDHSCSSLLK